MIVPSNSSAFSEFIPISVGDALAPIVEGSSLLPLQFSGFTGDYSQTNADRHRRRLRLRRRKDADVPREDALHLRLEHARYVHGH